MRGEVVDEGEDGKGAYRELCTEEMSPWVGGMNELGGVEWTEDP